MALKIKKMNFIFDIGLADAQTKVEDQKLGNQFILIPFFFVLNFKETRTFLRPRTGNVSHLLK